MPAASARVVLLLLALGPGAARAVELHLDAQEVFSAQGLSILVYQNTFFGQGRFTGPAVFKSKG